MNADELIRRAMCELAKRRAEKLPKKRRQEIASNAGQARWRHATAAEKQATVKRLHERLAEVRAQRREEREAAEA